MMVERTQDPQAPRCDFDRYDPSIALIERANGPDRRRRGISRGCSRSSLRADGKRWFVLNLREATERPLRFAFGCFPPASPAFLPEAGKQTKTPTDPSDSLICFKKIGAGEGIRTLDPDLGKAQVVRGH
jgi:hypothetical protein